MPLFYGIKKPLENLNLDYSKILTLPIELTKPESLHITILYIGSSKIRSNILQEVDSVLQQIPRFKIIIGPEVDIFPSLMKPRAVVLKVIDRSGMLNMIRSKIFSILNRHGIKIEDRYVGEFRPHLTVGYIRSKLDYESAIDILEIAKELLKDIRIEVIVDRIELIDSTGGVYKVVYTHWLSS